VGVISGVPSGVLLPPQTMADTRDLVNHLAGSERALSQAMIDPKAPPGSSTALDSMEHQVRDLGAVALKCYTYNGNWWLDDERVSYPMLAEATRLGLRLINCHKGLPNLAFFPLSAEYVRTRDLPKVVRDWPQLEFCAYHAGYFPEEGGNGEFIRVARSLPRKYRRNLYAEIGSSFAITFLDSPEGRLLHRAPAQDPRLAQHPVGHRLRMVGLAPVADRRLQDAPHPRPHAGALRLPAAHAAGEASHPGAQCRASLWRRPARPALRDRRRSHRARARGP